MAALTHDIKTIRIKPDGSTYAVAAGTSTITSDIVDTAGYSGVRFILLLGAIVSLGVPTLKVQQDSAAGGGTMADLLGSLQSPTATDDNKLWISEIITPQERYLRLVTTRGTANTTVDGLIVELFGARRRPVTADATVGGQEVFVGPAEGTA